MMFEYSVSWKSSHFHTKRASALQACRACLERFSVYVKCVEVDFQNHGISKGFVRKQTKTRYKSSDRAVGYSPYLERNVHPEVLLAHVLGKRIALLRRRMPSTRQRNSLPTGQT
jgi:hypothetical protein